MNANDEPRGSTTTRAKTGEQPIDGEGEREGESTCGRARRGEEAASKKHFGLRRQGRLRKPTLKPVLILILRLELKS